jgi:hypothetical protein
MNDDAKAMLSGARLRERRVEKTEARALLAVEETTMTETAIVKKVKGFQYGTDHLKQMVLIRTIFLDDTTSDTPIPRGNIQETIEYLEQALRSFEAQGSQTRQ